jgi:hypothetical protein
MRYPRRHRLLSAIAALLSLLFMQLALAAYACPNLDQVQRTPMVDSSGQPMADCPEIDKHSPALCYADTHKQTPSLEKPNAPSVTPFVATGLAVPILWLRDSAPMPNPPSIFLQTSGTSPPLAIRHCCFRL